MHSRNWHKITRIEKLSAWPSRKMCVSECLKWAIKLEKCYWCVIRLSFNRQNKNNWKRYCSELKFWWCVCTAHRRWTSATYFRAVKYNGGFRSLLQMVHAVHKYSDWKYSKLSFYMTKLIGKDHQFSMWLIKYIQ